MKDTAYYRAYVAKRRATGQPFTGDAAYHRDYRRTRRLAGNVVGKIDHSIRPFVAIDGEGYTRESGEHVYNLLGASDGSSVASVDGIATLDALRYLVGLRRNWPDAYFVAFAFGYDVNMILRDIAWDKLALLHQRGWIVQRFGSESYRIEYRPGKWFCVSRYDHDRTCTKVYDTFGFFQTAFAPAMRDMGVIDTTSPEWSMLTSMKAQRGAFTPDDYSAIRAYNDLELALLVSAMLRFRDAFETLGLHPSGWHGAGAIAAAMLRREKIKDHIVAPPDTVELPVMSAYFGGRIEAYQIGEIGRVYAHDIRSAYPSTLVDLPSLADGEWVRESDPDNPISLYRVRWHVPLPAPFGPFPFRTEDGSIAYPRRGEGWYWQSEYIAAAHTFGVERFTIIDAWSYQGYDRESRPFSWVADLYEQRRQLQRAGMTAEQKALKLGLNSLYGKLAQGTGYDKRAPAYQSYIYAGMVTAGTRARLLNAAMRDPSAVVSFATDGIYTTRPLDVATGDALGEWECAAHDDMFVLQPGVFEYRDGDVWTRRTRGFRVSDLDYAALRAAWRESGAMLQHELQTTRFYGLGIALSRSDPTIWRTWRTETRVITPINRRMSPASFVGSPARVLRLYPLERAGDVSAPYTPAARAEDSDDERILASEQPDASETGW